MMRGDRRFVALMLAPALFLVACFYVYPTIFNIENSLTSLTLFELRTGGEWVGVDNYVELFSTADFRRVLFNTIVWLTLVGVGVRIVLGLALAFLINSPVLAKYRLRTLARLSLLVPWATPPIVAAVVWKWIFDPRVGSLNALLLKLGVVDQPIAFFSELVWIWPALIFIITWNTLPLVTLAFLAGLQSLPAEQVEAARVDGARGWQVIWYIVLPHLRPTIIVMVLLSTFWTFNNFVYVWLITGAGPGTYTNVMATEVFIKTFVDGKLGQSSAVGVVMATLMTAFGLLYLRVIAQREFHEIFAKER